VNAPAPKKEEARLENSRREFEEYFITSDLTVEHGRILPEEKPKIVLRRMNSGDCQFF
jgi:hypothetical protein